MLERGNEVLLSDGSWKVVESLKQEDELASPHGSAKVTTPPYDPIAAFVAEHMPVVVPVKEEVTHTRCPLTRKAGGKLGLATRFASDASILANRNRASIYIATTTIQIRTSAHSSYDLTCQTFYECMSHSIRVLPVKLQSADPTEGHPTKGPLYKAVTPDFTYQNAIIEAIDTRASITNIVLHRRVVPVGEDAIYALTLWKEIRKTTH